MILTVKACVATLGLTLTFVASGIAASAQQPESQFTPTPQGQPVDDPCYAAHSRDGPQPMWEREKCYKDAHMDRGVAYTYEQLKHTMIWSMNNSEARQAAYWAALAYERMGAHAEAVAAINDAAGVDSDWSGNLLGPLDVNPDHHFTPAFINDFERIAGDEIAQAAAAKAVEEKEHAAAARREAAAEARHKRQQAAFLAQEQRKARQSYESQVNEARDEIRHFIASQSGDFRRVAEHEGRLPCHVSRFARQGYTGILWRYGCGFGGYDKVYDFINGRLDSEYEP
jgi:hypothetical protein